jgi:hypothetical protein
MKPHTRRAVAAAALAVTSGETPSSVYDYGASKYVSFSGSVTSAAVDLYDYGQRCHVGGNRNGLKASLFHYGNGKHIDLEDQGGGKFSGFDYDSGKHYDVTVEGTSVSLYDYEHSAYFNYST